MNILVTGGTGYIGSHTCVELLKENHNVIIVDNLYNSSKEVINSIEKISNKTVKFYQYDLCNIDDIEKIFIENKIDAVIHFAGLKAVGESVQKPLLYFHNNLHGTINLCTIMAKYNVKNIIFSSTATVYGDNVENVPFSEDMPTGNVTNPYAKSKLFIEQILDDIYTADKEWNITILRYFNPTGAHESGDLGEDPNGIPNNLLPYVSKVAIGKLPEIQVFGDDYDTPDGTGVRDYIHVVDLAIAHVKALKLINEKKEIRIYNLSTGIGNSVLDVIHSFEKACGKKLPYKIVARRAGDISTAYGNPTKAKKELDWEAKFDLDRMCADNWHWQSKHPNGYKE